MQIRIYHTGYQENQPMFIVIRGSDGKRSELIPLDSPEQRLVEGRPQSNLAMDLRWYLEDFLQLPMEGYLSVADRVYVALDRWGKDCFKSLFQGQTRDWFQDARQAGLECLELEICSEDSAILAWPWEALNNEDDGKLALRCRMTRRLSLQGDPLPLPSLPQDGINILLIIARPYGDRDVDFHALSRPLIELAREQRGMLRVDVLRPSTFAALREILEQNPDYYHIVHFDGHGDYEDGQAGMARGVLIFEDSASKPHAVAAETLSQLLAEHHIPIMVLNACRSAQVNAQARDAYASVAAALIWSGVRYVVAMGYSLYVSGAQQFIPTFYRRLLKCGDVGEAVRAGRQSMYATPERDCMIGQYFLHDWVVPVVYRQCGPEERILPQMKSSQRVMKPNGPDILLPREVLEMGSYGFIGRARAIHNLERACRNQRQAAILLHGMAGVGKTTLVKGFLRWLMDTGGLENTDGSKNIFWFDFRNIHSTAYILDQLTENIFGFNACANSEKEKMDALCRRLHDTSFWIIWDNFESASEIPGVDAVPLLNEEDHNLLKELLHRLRNGKTRILITSRSPEDWLSLQECFRVPLSGLQGEELWAYCNEIVRDLGLHIDQGDTDVQELIKKLDGNPLVLRAMLLRLDTTPAAELVAELQKRFTGQEGDESTNCILAALGVFDHGLSRNFRPILEYIGLHDRFVDEELLKLMLEKSGDDLTHLLKCQQALIRAGLLWQEPRKRNFYAMHPVLRLFLQQRYPVSIDRTVSFIEVFSNYANDIAQEALCKQRKYFEFHGANFRYALKLAQQQNRIADIMFLLQSKALFSYYTLNYEEAVRLYNMLLDLAERQEELPWVALAYHQLGMVAAEQKDFGNAELWYQCSLALKECSDNREGQAITCHQLGVLAAEQNDFPEAKQWYERALEIEKQLNDQQGEAQTCHQLGILAAKLNDFQEAKQWYERALEIKKQLNDQQGEAQTCHQLGVLAAEQNDFQEAKQWYQRSLVLKKRLNDQRGKANTYYSLGRLEQGKGNFQNSEQWFRLALEITEHLGDARHSAKTLYALGLLHKQKQDFRKSGECFLNGLLHCVKSKTALRMDKIFLNAVNCLFKSAPEQILPELQRLWKDAELDKYYVCPIEYYER